MVRTWPRRRTPLMTGGLVATGAPDVTAPTAADDALPTPYGLVAVTVTRSLLPTSDAPGTYVDAVAPAIGVHVAPPSKDRSQTLPYEAPAGLQVPVDALSVAPCRGVPVIVGRVPFT